MGISNSTDALVQEYLAGGGRIRTIPEAMPVTAREVLQYLKTQQIVVKTVKGKNAHSAHKYRYGTKLLTWRELLEVANRFRRKQRLAPFETRQAPFSSSYLGRAWGDPRALQSDTD
jgi:hypothetical protein